MTLVPATATIYTIPFPVRSVDSVVATLGIIFFLERDDVARHKENRGGHLDVEAGVDR